MKLIVAKEFSRYPHGRDESDDEYNGAAFRKILAEKFQQAQEKGEPLEVVLDNVHALGGSFMDEAFGEFAKQLLEEENRRITPADLYIHGDLPYYEYYVDAIWHYINEHYSSGDNSADAA